jgi:hypothetical protein
MTLSELDRRYPFDPKLEGRTETLRGLEKLRGVRDRELALTLYAVHKANEKAWTVQEHKARQRAAYAAHGASSAEPDVRQRQAGER